MRLSCFRNVRGYVASTMLLLISLSMISPVFAATRADSPPDPETPRNLTSAIYSPKDVEIFWARAENPFTQYDVFRNGVLVSEGQFGISYFDRFIDPTLNPPVVYTYTIVALNQQGVRSESASIVVDPSGDGSGQASVPSPQGLRVTVYAPNNGELFWDRAAEGFTRYDVFRNGTLLSAGQFGISFFDRSINPDEVFEYAVVAIDAQGNRSEPSTVSINGNGSPMPPANLLPPANLSISVYSNTAAELFWDRQGPGQRFVVLRDGVELGNTDGTSFFDDGLPGQGSYLYEVFAVDADGARSAPATVTGVVGGQQPPGPVSDSILNLDNAVSVVQEIILVAYGAPFEPMVEEARTVSELVNDAAFASLAGSPAPVNGVSLIAGTDGGPTETAVGGFNGGLYTCDAGGSAAMPAFRSFESGLGYIAGFTDCVLSTGVYTGGYQLVTPVPRSGNLGSDQLSEWQADRSDGDSYHVLLLDDGTTTQFADRSLVTSVLSVNGFESTLTGQQVFIDDLEATRVSRFGNSQDFDQLDENGAPITRDFAEASLTANFDISSPDTAQQRVDVELSLAYDYAGIEDPVLRWQTGSILIRAADGSELIVQPEGDTVRIRVSAADGFVDVPYDDIF